MPHKSSLLLCLLALVMSGCAQTAATPLPAGYAQTAAAQTWEAVQVSFTPTTLPDTPTLPPTETAAPLPTATATETRPPLPSITPRPTTAPTLPPAAQAQNLPARPETGYPAPDFSLEEASDGRSVSLSQMRGRPVILIFWATWCPYCQKSLPIVQNAYSSRNGDGLVVLAVDEQESSKKVLKAAQNMGLTFTLLLDPHSDVQDLYRVTGYPTTFFVNRNGVIIGKHIGALSQSQIDAYLPSLLTK